MPIYNESKNAAFFFVIFVITTTLYLHSLVLSVVFQTYVQASAIIHERSIAHREESLRFAFVCLQEDFPDDDTVGVLRRVRTGSIRKTLRLLRPHYNAMKINALVEIVDPSGRNFVDYDAFRTKVPQSLIASIRSTPSRNVFSQCIEVIGAVVAVSNFVYVVLLTSQFQAYWFDVITFPLGFAITLLGLFELVARANPRNVFRYTPSDKLNVTFDGLAAVAALVSCWAIFHRHIELELMLTGRAIDMIRIMRFQRIFRDAVRRSGEVFPALVGPTVLVVATLHVFVCIGMAIWGGEIQVGTYGDSIVPFYDLNNFNSYWEVSSMQHTILRSLIGAQALLSSTTGSSDNVSNPHCQRLAFDRCCLPSCKQTFEPLHCVSILHCRPFRECQHNAELFDCVFRGCVCDQA